MSNAAAIIRQPVRHDWETPIGFFRALDAEFHFDLDAAASTENHLVDHYYTEHDDALRFDWFPAFDSIWCNPPYGTQIGKWVGKCYEEGQKGATVVMLIPARTETSYWHEYVMKASEIRLVRGRLRFSGVGINAPFPSAVIVFRPGDHAPTVSAMGRNGDA